MTQGALEGLGGVVLDPGGARVDRMGAVERAVWTAAHAGQWVRTDDGWRSGSALLPTLIGVDEAGRGPLAGPVSVAAVILSPMLLSQPPEWLSQLDDSKRLDEETRAALFPHIQSASVAWSITHVHASHIDHVNILQATFHGMAICVEAALGLAHGRIAGGPRVTAVHGERAAAWYRDSVGDDGLEGAHVCSGASAGVESVRAVNVLVDGNKRFKAQGSPAGDLTQHPIVKGDGLSYHIAAASVLAKVSRDAVMGLLDCRYPVYGFGRHKGYPTVAHRDAVRAHGICPHHRATFRRS